MNVKKQQEKLTKQQQERSNNSRPTTRGNKKSLRSTNKKGGEKAKIQTKEENKTKQKIKWNQNPTKITINEWKQRIEQKLEPVRNQRK